MFMKRESDESCDLFDLLIQLSKRGIDKLLQTYSTTEQPALLHTLQLYRVLLDKPNLLTDHEEIEINRRHGISTNLDAITCANNMDDIFINIRNIYSSHEYIILYQSLILLEKNTEHYNIYLQGLNTMFSPSYDKIQKWISDNIVF